MGETLDLRQNKRYRLKASVTFAWQQNDGTTSRGEGYTRDISASGVYVLTPDRLPAGTPVKLEVLLPSLREKQSGAALRTQGHVVRSEAIGFAAVADLGFRMRIPGNTLEERSLETCRGNGKYEQEQENTSAEEVALGRARLVSRFWM